MAEFQIGDVVQFGDDKRDIGIVIDGSDRGSSTAGKLWARWRTDRWAALHCNHSSARLVTDERRDMVLREFALHVMGSK